MEATNTYSILIKPGIALDFGQQQYRVLHVQKSIAVLCEMRISQLRLLAMPLQALMQQCVDGQARIITPPSPKPFDMEKFSASARKAFHQKMKIVQTIKAHYGPAYLGLKDPQDKEVLAHCITDSGLSKPTVLRIIRLFLQAGEDYAALVDGRAQHAHSAPKHYTSKPGRPSMTGIARSDMVERHFTEAMEYYTSGRTATQEAAYIRMLRQHYSHLEDADGGGQTLELLPASERPTLRQFRYYIHTHLSRETLDCAKTSAREQRNDKRLLLSDNLYDVHGPGDLFEMDEVEVDVSLVSRIDSSQVVGRPIVYVMVDVYSRLIVGYSVAYDNNSLVGMTNCLLSLLDDKVQLCQKFGVFINADVWPSKILPQRIRSDYGSEYRSVQAGRIFAELGITRELVSPASGSLKGQVEQVFHQFHSSNAPLLEGKGLITKRHDSNHHQSASLTVDAFEALLIRFIVSHNQQYLKKYPLTIEMSRENVPPIPARLWQYGCTHFGAPRHILNETQFLYSLLIPVSASLSRQGVIREGLYYINEADAYLMAELYNAGSKRKQKPFRIDPRDVERMYYIDHNRNLAFVTLNLARSGNNFHGYSWAEYKKFQAKKRELDKLGENYEYERKAQLKNAQEAVMHQAIKGGKRKISTKKISEVRQIEKLDKSQDYSIATRLLGSGTTFGDVALPALPLSDEMEDAHYVAADFMSGQISAFLRDVQDYEDA